MGWGVPIEMKRWSTLVLIIFAITGCSLGLSDADYVERAKSLLAKGDARGGMIELANALKINSDNAEARWLRAEIQLRQGSPAGAEKEFRRALALGVAPDSIHPLLAEALLAQGKFDEVLGLPLGQLSVPSSVEVLALQSAVRASRWEIDLATAAVTEALSLSPDSPAARTEAARLALLDGGPDAARQLLEAVLNETPTYARAWSLLGSVERQEQRWAEADEAYSRAIEHRPNNFDDRLNRAFVRIERKAYQSAEADIAGYLKRFPRRYQGYLAQGMVDLGLGRYEAAGNHLEKAAELGPDNLPASYYLAVAKYQVGALAQARRLAEHVTSKAPNLIPARLLLAQIQLQSGNYSDVETLVAPIIAARADDVQALGMLATALVRQDKIVRGAELLERLVSLQPESAQARVDLGSALLIAGDESRAIREFQTAITLDPDQQIADVLLARHFLKIKAFGDATKVADEHRRRHPTSPLPHIMKGLAFLGMGRTADAGASFETALALDPGNRRATEQLALLALSKGDSATARSVLESALAVYPTDYEILLKLAEMDRRDGLEDAMLRRIESAISVDTAALGPRLAMARYLLWKGEPEKVRAAMGDLTERDKSDPDVARVLGTAALAQRDSAAAASWFADLVRLQPGSAGARYLLGLAHAQAGRHDLMLTEMEGAIALDPKHVPARRVLVRWFLLKDELTEAGRHLEVLRELAPAGASTALLAARVAQEGGELQQASALYAEAFEKDASTRNLLALAQHEWQFGSRDESIALQEGWVASRPADVKARVLLANAYAAIDRISDAIQQLEAALVYSPDDFVLLNNLAWHLRESSPARALRYSDKAVQLAPDVPSVIDTRAMVLLANGELDRAIRASDRLIDRSPSDPVYNYHRALILERQGKAEEARILLNEVLDANGEKVDRAEVEQALARLRKLP